MNGKITHIGSAVYGIIACTILFLITGTLEANAENEEKTVRIPGNHAIFRQIDSTIISGGADSAKARTAYTLYNFFIGSSVMGDENYAVYIAENYFLNGKLKIPNENAITLIKLYCDFNSKSLVGMENPDLTLYDRYLEPIGINDRKCRFKIIYFYDTDCSQCNIQTPLLSRFMHESGCAGVDIYAVYTGTSSEKWQKYISENNLECRQSQNNDGNNFNTIRIFHLYDPEMLSEFHILYNVMKTPQLVLVDENGIIAGRNLDVINTVRIIGERIRFSDSVKKFISGLLEEVNPQTYGDLKYIIDGFYEKSKDDDLMYRETMMEMYSTFKSSGDYRFMLASEYIAEEYMLGKPEYWSSRFIAEMSHEMEMFRRNRLGSRMEDLELSDIGGNRVLLSGICGKRTVVYFNDLNCPVCKAVEEDMDRIIGKYPDVKFISIYTGTDSDAWTEYAFRKSRKKKNAVYLNDCNGESEMYEKFDLRYVPSIYLIGNDMIILAKDINTITLESLLKKEKNDNR